MAIIGSQNTGKSTLLNELFHTNFKVLEGLAGTRTTRGVILGREEFPAVNFVMDQKQCFTLRSAKHTMVQNFYVGIPETDEMIRVTVNHIEQRDSNFVYIKKLVFMMVIRW